MLTVEPSLDDLLSTAFFSTPFRRRRESLQCGRTQSFDSGRFHPSHLVRPFLLHDAISLTYPSSSVLYRSVDCPTRRPPCPTVTRGTIGGRRHAYRKSIEFVTTRVTNLLLPTTTSTPSAARRPPTWPATTTPTAWSLPFPILTPRDVRQPRQRPKTAATYAATYSLPRPRTRFRPDPRITRLIGTSCSAIAPFLRPANRRRHARGF